jgi:hypothetical protein
MDHAATEARVAAVDFEWNSRLIDDNRSGLRSRGRRVASDTPAKRTIRVSRRSRLS